MPAHTLTQHQQELNKWAGINRRWMAHVQGRGKMPTPEEIQWLKAKETEWFWNEDSIHTGWSR
jgi:hypothetical protein